MIRTVLRGSSKAYPEQQALVAVVDLEREHHCVLVPTDQMLEYMRSEDQAQSAFTELVVALEKRLPHPDGTAKPWAGAELFATSTYSSWI